MTLTKKYPLSFENRSLSLCQLRVYDILISHKFSSVFPEEKQAEFKLKFDSCFQQYYEFIRHTQPFECANNLVEFFISHPKLCDKYVF